MTQNEAFIKIISRLKKINRLVRKAGLPNNREDYVTETIDDLLMFFDGQLHKTNEDTKND